MSHVKNGHEHEPQTCPKTVGCCIAFLIRRTRGITPTHESTLPWKLHEGPRRFYDSNIKQGRVISLIRFMVRVFIGHSNSRTNLPKLFGSYSGGIFKMFETCMQCPCRSMSWSAPVRQQCGIQHLLAEGNHVGLQDGCHFQPRHQHCLGELEGVP